MILRTIIFLVLLNITSVLQSQSGWFFQYNSQNENIQDLYFLNKDTGWAVGWNGSILKTTNGGSRWDSNNISPEYQITSVLFVNGSTGFAGSFEYTGDFVPYLFRSSDGGLSWNVSFTLFGSATMSNISFVDQNTGFFGINYLGIGHIYKTTNAGLSWYSINANIGNGFGVNYINFLKEGRGYVSISKTINQNEPVINAIIKSTDSGITWTEINRDTVPYSNTAFNRKVFFVNDSVGFLQRGNLYKTTNGGSNFTILNTGFINSFCFSGNDTGWCTGYSGKIIKTTNGGNTWSSQNIISNSDLFPIYFISSSTGWAGGYIGNGGGNIIVKTVTGGITSVSSIAETPENYKLFQNYPNPFNPITNIRYTIASRGKVNLSLYNMLGVKITTLIDEINSEGTYDVKFDAEKYGLSSGIYFYTLSSSDFTQTKKFIILK